MLRILRSWRRRRLLRSPAAPPDDALWQARLADVPTAAGLSGPEQRRLRELVTLFLDEKRFEGADGLAVDTAMRTLIATQACLPILNLGFESYDGWWTVILYPGAFVARHQHIDAAGVVHDVALPSDGEAWDRGPLVLSWDDVVEDLAFLDGSNVVIHECAHKLDMLDGAANGVPRLPRGLRPEAWRRDFERAYQRFHRQVARGHETLIDPYAAESPAEFFAVLSEAFFEIPADLAAEYPPLYRHLRDYYRQDPEKRDRPPSPGAGGPRG